MLFASLVLRVMTISSGVTRRNAARVLRRLSFSPFSRARFCADGSRSTLSLSRLSASSTGREAGQRFAAFSTPSSSGITNCARTDFQKASPVPDRVGENAGACACAFAQAGSAKSAAEPPMANRRAKSRRDTDAAMDASGRNSSVSSARERSTMADRNSGKWIAIGVAMGTAMGVAMGNIGAGIAIGVAIGAAMMAANKKKA